jgi:hypothetical protein
LAGAALLVSLCVKKNEEAIMRTHNRLAAVPLAISLIGIPASVSAQP